MHRGFADFDRLQSAADYERLVSTAVRGVPPEWIPEIAKQCLYAPTSSSGKRYDVHPLCVCAGAMRLSGSIHATAIHVLVLHCINGRPAIDGRQEKS